MSSPDVHFFFIVSAHLAEVVQIVLMQMVRAGQMAVMSHFGKQFHELWKKRAKVKLPDLASESGVSLRTLRAWEKAEDDPSQPDKYRAVADALANHLQTTRMQIDNFWLRGVPLTIDLADRIAEIENRPPSGRWNIKVDAAKTVARRIPLAQDGIAAGKPIEGNPVDAELANDSVAGDVWPWDDRAFGIKVAGNSMFPEYRNSDIVIGSPGLFNQVTSGDDVCVLFTHESQFRGRRTLKRIELLHEGKIILHPLNPDHDPLEVDRADIADIGPVAAHIRYPVKQNKKWDLKRVGLARRFQKPPDVPEQEHPDYTGPEPKPDDDL